MLDTGNVIMNGSTIGTDDFPTLKTALMEIFDLYSGIAEDQNIVVNIVKKQINNVFKSTIMNHLTPFSISIKDEILEDIKTQIRHVTTKADRGFIYRFVETQMFSTYIENRYLNPNFNS